MGVLSWRQPLLLLRPRWQLAAILWRLGARLWRQQPSLPSMQPRSNTGRSRKLCQLAMAAAAALGLLDAQAGAAALDWAARAQALD